MSYSVDWINRVVTIPTADLTLVSGTRYSLPMGDFLAEIRRLEWEPTEGLWAPAIVDHSNTRFDFAGANYAGFDEIINGYTIQFTGAAERVDLLDSNNNFIDALIPTGVSVVPSNSAGLTSFVSKDIADVKYLIENQRPHHTGQGTVLYWSPDLGNDNADGTSVSQAVKTFARAHDLASDGAHDIIVALSGVAGQTVVDEHIHITKRFTFLRGPGRDFMIKPTGTLLPSVKIDAVGVEVSSMLVETAVAGSQNAIEVADGADFFFLDQVWSNFAAGATIHIDAPIGLKYGRIDGGFFSHAQDHGIHINGNIRHTRIRDTEVDGAGSDGIVISGTTARNNIIERNVKIYACGGYGMHIEAPCLRNVIGEDVDIYDNALGDILDEGTSTENHSKYVADVHKRLGLNKNDPITDNAAGITSQSGDINIVRTGDGETTSTLTRQP